MTPRRVCDGPGSCRNVGVFDATGEYDLVGVKESVDAPDGYEGPAYCSLECAAYAGVRLFNQQEGKDDATS